MSCKRFQEKVKLKETLKYVENMRKNQKTNKNEQKSLDLLPLKRFFSHI